MRIISGNLGGRHIKTSSGPGYRPATDKVRSALFSMLQARGLVWEGLRVLDLFAGSGSLAMEALSRGAAWAGFVEKAGPAAALIERNLRDFGVEAGRWRVFRQDVAAFLRRFEGMAGGPTDGPSWGLVFIDPPYGKGLLSPTLSALVKQGGLAPDGLVVAEVEAAVGPEAAQDLPLTLFTDRTYGQTRILAWKSFNPAGPSTPEPSTP